MAAATENDDNGLDNQLKPESEPVPEIPSLPSEVKPLSKNAQKRQLKQQRYEAKKAEKKAQEKEHKKKQGERKLKEWEETLANATEEERLKLIESRKNLRKERMQNRSEEKLKKMDRLNRAKEIGQNVVVDVDFAHLMSDSEISSLVQQIMYCYAVNGRSTSPCHLWLTGVKGQMSNELDKLPGFEKWFVEKESRCYIEAMADRKEDLVYLTADSETVLDDLNPKSIYIIGGLVDRNRHKGITMTKAEEQGIKTAKLPIGEYMKMSSSQVLTVNQVVEILVKYLETRDWKTSFFTVIPQRKRTVLEPIDCSKSEPLSEEHQEKEDDENESEERHNLLERKKVLLGSLRFQSYFMSSTNPMVVEEVNGLVKLLTGVEDKYGGVMMEMTHPMDPYAFSSLLRASLSNWTIQGKKGVWIKLPIQLVGLAETAVKEGFWFHHAENNYLMLVYWIPIQDNSLPANASHRVRIGAFVINHNKEVLVVQEKTGRFQGQGIWKFPTGVVNEGEDIHDGSVREVKEETGVDTEFIKVLDFRQTHKTFFDKSELFFLCLLKPLSLEINAQDSEIEAAQWMPWDDYMKQPSIHNHELLKYMTNICYANINSTKI